MLKYSKSSTQKPYFKRFNGYKIEMFQDNNTSKKKFNTLNCSKISVEKYVQTFERGFESFFLKKAKAF